ncbi:MAG: hypothetical protein AB7H93_03945 [Vicinamibacterales bacterium]
MSWRLALALGFVVLTALRGDAQGPSAGTGTIYVGSYSGHITAVDEASGTFTKIPLSSGPPFVVRLSPDKTRFYVQSANQEKFEVVDVRARKSIDAFTLSDGRRHVRAMAFEADPQHRTLVLVTRTATKQIDRWEIGAPEFVVYDLATHTITRTVPWTIDDEPALYGVALRFSPDGKYLYVFGNQVTIFDAATMHQVDSWDLSLPTDTSMSRFDAGPQDDSADRPGFVTGLFVTQDAVMKRKTLAVGQIDLAAKTVDVFPLGPVPEADGMSFTVAPGRKRANILLAEIGRHRLLSIDMEARRVTGQVDVPTRTRMQMRTSANGLLYLYEAGRTIEIFSADAATRLRTIELDSDMMYGTFTIVPASPGR